MYPFKLDIKDKTESNMSASFLDLFLSSERNNQFHNSIYDKREDFIQQIFRFWAAIFHLRPRMVL